MSFDDDVVEVHSHPNVVSKKDGWVTVGGAAPEVDFRRAVVSEPTGITAAERQERNLALARVKFSPANPKVPPGVSMAAYQACETVRVHARNAQADGLPTYEVPRWDGIPQDQVGKALWDKGPLFAASALVETYPNYYGDHAYVGTAIKDHAQSLIDALPEDDPKRTQIVRQYKKICYAAEQAVGELYRRANPGPNAAIRAAEKLQWEISPPKPPPPQDGSPQSGQSQSGDGDAEHAKSGKALRQPSFDEVVDSTMRSHSHDRNGSEVLRKKVRESASKGKGPYDWLNECDAADWGDMEIVLPDLRHRLLGRMKAPGYVPGDKGSVFKYYQRYAVDQAVFARKVIKEGGCSVLIDTSGSMDLDVEDVADIVRMLPGAIVATYNGNVDEGNLVIVAQKGMWCDEEQLFGADYGGNAIDGPALRWLAEQKGPRIWVSDGYVVGRRGIHAELNAECQGICLANRILRLPNMQACKDYMEKGYRS